jgi:hypothetical protein
MKKQAKKLVLAKETVRRLGDRNLGKVAGGFSRAIDYTCNTDCCGTSAGPMICGNELQTTQC